MLSIGVKYCGGCNPQIDRSKAVSELKEKLANSGINVDITFDEEKSVDVILLVNGCLRGCLDEEYGESGVGSAVISVKGEMIDDRFVSEGSIAQSLAEKIMNRAQSAGLQITSR